MVNTYYSKTMAITLATLVSFLSVCASQERNDTSKAVVDELTAPIEAEATQDPQAEEQYTSVEEESVVQAAGPNTNELQYVSDAVVSIQEPEDTASIVGNKGTLILRDYCCAPREGARITIINSDITPSSTVIVQSKNFGSRHACIDIDDVYAVHGRLIIDIINQGYEVLDGDIRLTFSILD